MAQASLHSIAINAEEALEQLATGLASAQADPAAVQTVEKMAAVTRKIVKALGQGQEETGDEEPPAPEAQPAPPPRRRTIQSATEDLRREAQAGAGR